MNYLAHIFLARQSDEAMLGALLGDFVKANVSGKYTPEIEREISIHRKVDVFTDSHPIVRAAKLDMIEARRRYAGILLDIFYDHVLITNWSRYSEQPVEQIIARFYAVLQKRVDILPENLARMLPYMVAQDWLGSYREFAGVEVAVTRVSHRLSRNGDLLRDGLQDLRANYASLSTGFNQFFPELIRFAEEQRANLVLVEHE